MSFTIYGAGVGFLIVYLWVRLRLRVLLESTEQPALDQRTVDVATSLAVVSTGDLVRRGVRATPQPKSPASITAAAARVVATVQQVAETSVLQVLWVDDHPYNNRAEL